MKKIFKGSNFSAVFTDEDGYYSLTGDISGHSGAVGERLVEIDKNFEPLEALHLCDVGTGKPIHALENAEYYIKRNKPNCRVAKTLRVSENLASELAELWRVHECKKKIGDKDDIEVAAENLADKMEKIEEVWKGRVDDLEDSIEELSEYFPENRPGFVEPLDENGEVFAAYSDLSDDELDRMTALARHLNVNISEIEGVTYDDTVFEAEGRTYLVVTDVEADDLWDKDLDNYIDDCLEIPAQIEPYFDRDAWKRDAKMDGRGHSLGRYDGNEHFAKGVDETYFIYRR